MNKDKIEFYSHLTVTVVGALLLLYIFARYLLFVTLPFLISWGVAFSIRPLALKISSGTHIPYKVTSASLTVLIVLGGIAVIISAVAYALGEAWDFLSGVAESDVLYDILDKVMNPISGFLGDREGAAELEAHISEAVSSMLTSLLSGIVGSLTAFVTSVPKALVFVLVTVISSIYFSLDLENINSFVRKKLPKKASNWLVNFKNRFLKTLIKYLRSYIVIMLMTFIIMLFGFLVLGVKYAVLFAFIVALLDALPLIGVGTVLVPWSVYQLVFGNTGLGIGLIILFVSHAVLRQFIEPKIVGKNLGIHPVISLILLYLGYYFFGFLGLFLIPLLTVIVNILINKDDSSEVA